MLHLKQQTTLKEDKNHPQKLKIKHKKEQLLPPLQKKLNQMPLLNLTTQKKTPQMLLTKQILH